MSDALLAALLCIALLSGTSAKAANDVVRFENGDQLTGEIKSMSRGQLQFKTDATGTIDIEWDKVAYISSEQNVQVETQSGRRFFGHIDLADSNKKVVVLTSGGPMELETARVIAMNPIDQGGLKDIDINVNVGYNFTKASNVTQFNVGADAKYRTRKRILSANVSSYISDSENNESSQKQSLAFNYTRLRSDRWLNDGGISFDRNDELGLNLRTSLSAGGGRILLQTNNSMFTLKGGLKATRENNADQPEDVDSLESYGIMSWEWYRYDSPELDWSTSLEIIPSLTESGRIRGEFDATLSWEIFSDFFWQLQFYDSYDNKPQTDGTPTNDYGVNTSLSYKF